MINKRSFDLFTEVLAAMSRRDGKFRTQKQVLVEGLDVLIRAAVFERYFYLKTFDRDLHRGERPFFFQFDGGEKRLVQETRALLQEDSGAKLTTHDTLILALLAAAKAVNIKLDSGKEVQA